MKYMKISDFYETPCENTQKKNLIKEPHIQFDGNEYVHTR